MPVNAQDVCKVRPSSLIGPVPRIDPPADHVCAYRTVYTVPAVTSLAPLFSLAFFIPPLAVLLERGCGADFVINILLVSLRTPRRRRHPATY